MDRPRVLRAPTGLYWLVGVAAVAAFLLGDVAVRGSVPQAVLIAPWLLIPVWFVYVFLYAPHVAASEEGVRVHNVLRIVELPWSTVSDIVMRWQLEFHVSDAARSERSLPAAVRRKGMVEAWAMTARRRQTRAAREATARDDSDTLEVLRAMRADAAPRPGARASGSWNWVAIVPGALLAAWAVSAWLIAG